MTECILSDDQFIRFESRVVPQMEIIERSGLAEHQKLLAIRHIVSGTIDDLKATYREYAFVGSSRLPLHDDVTIDRLAKWQRTLREDESLTDPERALALEKLEHGELLIQHAERPQLVLMDQEDDPPEEMLPWFAQGGE